MLLWHAFRMTDLERQLTRRRLLELGLVLPPLAAIAGRTDLSRSPALAATPDDPRRRRRPDAGADRGPLLHPELPQAQVDPPRRRGRHAAHPHRPRADHRRQADPECADRLLAGECPRRLRQQRLPLPRPPVTNAKGQYSLFTVVPGLYPGRTKHIHVKVQAPHEPVLTTQLFFPGVAGNRSDSIFTSECMVGRLAARQGPPARHVRLRPRRLAARLIAAARS